MENGPHEIVLTGGNVSTVVKIGPTVRRHTTRNSKTIHAFLRHLETKHLPAPRFLGIDAQGRETLSFIEGTTQFPPDLWQNDAWVLASAKLLRALHDASLDFTWPTTARWAYSYPDSARHEVISHNDFAPYNMVFGPDSALSIIDFDLCGPAPRVRDLAYLAYWLAPLSFGTMDMRQASEDHLRNGAPRLRLLCTTYGFDDAPELLAMVSEVLHHMSDENAAARMVGAQAARRLKSGGHFKHWAKEAHAFDRQKSALLACL